MHEITCPKGNSICQRVQVASVVWMLSVLLLLSLLASANAASVATNLTVLSGTGDGIYTNGAQVTITADAAPVCMTFPGLKPMFVAPPYTVTTNYYVATNGLDANSGQTTNLPWKTISRAISVLSGHPQGGVCVNVAPGIYAESPYLYNLNGSSDTPGGYLVFRSSIPQAAVITEPLSEAQVGMHTVLIQHSTNVIFDGFQVSGFAGTNTPGGAGFFFQYAKHIKILNCLIHDLSGGGIVGVQSDYFTVQGNIVYHTAGYNGSSGTSGIDFYAPLAADLVPGFHNVISGNISFCNFEMVDTKPSHTEGHGIMCDNFQTYSYLPATLIENNLCFGNGGCGINVFYSQHVTVRNNTAYHNGQDTNIVTYQVGNISVLFGTNNTIVNNIGYADNHNNVSLTRGPDLALVDSPGGADTNVWVNNLTFNGTAGQNAVSASITAANQNILGVDPLFASAGTENFSLLTNSPAIGNGTANYGGSTNLDLGDIGGNTRGSPPEIGAYGWPVTINSNTPNQWLFDQWVINFGNPTIVTSNAASTTLTMGTGAAAVTATYKVVLNTNISLKASDVGNNNSFNTGLNWLTGLPPSPGNSYFTAGFQLRTPTAGGTLYFLGDSLTLNPGPTNAASLILQGPSQAYFTNLIMAGGGPGIGPNGVNYSLGGNMYVNSNSYICAGGINGGGGYTNTIILFCKIYGSSTITNGTSFAPGGIVNYGSGIYLTFTGPIITTSGTTIQAGTWSELSGPPASFNPAQFTLNNGTFEPLASWTMDTGNSGETIGPGGGIFNICSGNIGSSGTFSIANPLAGTGTFTKSGLARLVFTGSGSNFTGNIIINMGTLALSGSASISNSPLISVTNGAIFDVSALNSTFDLGASQTLAGNGAVNGSVQADGTIKPGVSSIGTLTFNNNLTINGNLLFELNKSLTPSNDLVTVVGTLNNTGTGMLAVSNLGPALAVGDKFTLFSKPLPNGNILTIVPPSGVTFTNNLAVDGSIGVLSVPNTIATNLTNITVTVSGNALTLSWPADHTGWRLLVQTNHLDLGVSPNTNDWGTLTGSTVTNQMLFQINATNPNEFYRMAYP